MTHSKLVCALIMMWAAVGTGGCGESQSQTCDALQQEASQLVADNATCTSDADCQIGSVQARCLPAFVCNTALQTDVDQAALTAAARELEVKAQLEGCGCTMADCINPDQLSASCDSGSCVVNVMQ